MLIKNFKETISLPHPEEEQIKLREREALVKKDPPLHDYKIVRVVKSVFKKIIHIFKLLFSATYRGRCRTYVRRKNAVPKIESVFKAYLFRKSLNNRINKKKSQEAVIEKPAPQKEPAKAIITIRKDAATKIQSCFRGHRARVKAQTYRESKEVIAGIHQVLAESMEISSKLKKKLRNVKIENNLHKKNLTQSEKALAAVMERMGTYYSQEHLLNTFLQLQSRLQNSQKKTDTNKQFLSFFSQKHKEEYLNELKLQRDLEQQLQRCKGEIHPFNNTELNTQTAIHMLRQIQTRIQLLENEQREKKGAYEAASHFYQDSKGALDCCYVNSKEVKKTLHTVQTSYNKALEASNTAYTSLSKLFGSKVDIPAQEEIELILEEEKSKVVLEDEKNLPQNPVVIDLPEVAPQVLSPQQQMIATIGEHLNEDMQAIFTGLLQKFPEEGIHSWTCDHEGVFEMKLTQPVRIWLPSEKDNRVKGGVVMEFGGSSNLVKGRFDKANQTLIYDIGVKNICIAKVWRFTKEVTPELKRIVYKSKFHIEFIVKLGSLPEESSVNHFHDIQNEWDHKSELVIGDPWHHIRSKW